VIDRIYLNVTFKEKDYVKSIGGKWDNEAKSWYVAVNHFNPQLNNM